MTWISRQKAVRRYGMPQGILLELVDEVLDMGKLESGEIIMEERSFNLSRMLDNLYQVVEQQAVERGITIQVADYDVKHSSFVGSPIHIKRMFMNILSNAVSTIKTMERSY